jgi:hypothetical protein
MIFLMKLGIVLMLQISSYQIKAGENGVNGYQSVTNSPQTHWNRGTVLFVSMQNKMYRLTQEVESQRGRRQVKSPKAGELTGKFSDKTSLFQDCTQLTL